MTKHHLSRDRKLSLLLAKIITLTTDEEGLLLFHTTDDPAVDSVPKSALRRALSNWRAATLEAGADAAAAWQALEDFDAALAAVDHLLEDPTGDDRQHLADSLTDPTRKTKVDSL